MTDILGTKRNFRMLNDFWSTILSHVFHLPSRHSRYPKIDSSEFIKSRANYPFGTANGANEHRFRFA